ncbi:hypothetical protein M514_19417 [Trichuris suis]|uniref:Uncharacterized protein n=1 Tax=Trichuris suis TaxID=68888 RepID=A0A085NFX5_9BILA|nr:hypothetical protein M514_19417 [Trichuris suis]
MQRLAFYLHDMYSFFKAVKSNLSKWLLHCQGNGHTEGKVQTEETVQNKGPMPFAAAPNETRLLPLQSHPVMTFW